MIANNKTLLDRVIDKEHNNFIASVYKSFGTTDIDRLLQDGNVVYKIPFNRGSIKTLLQDNNTICIDTDSASSITSNGAVSNQNANTLVSYVTEKFINIPADASFTECMNIIHPYKIAAGEHFYGALLRSTTNQDIIINPYHVLTALSIMENPEYLEEMKFNVLIYIHTNREELDDKFNTHVADHSQIDVNINALMQSYTSKVETSVIADNITPQHDGKDVSISYRESIHPDEDKDHIHHIVAHQITTHGIISPYYGTSLIEWYRDRSSCKGIHLSPFMSCNLKGYDSTYITNELQNNIAKFDVCTGNEPNTSMSGLRTLTHSNLDSAHNVHAIRPGALAYADAMVNKTTELYIAADIIVPVEVADPAVCFTENELACMKLSDYIKLKRGSDGAALPLADLKARFNDMQQFKAEQEQSEPEPSTQYPITITDPTELRVGDYITCVHSNNGELCGTITKIVDCRDSYGSYALLGLGRPNDSVMGDKFFKYLSNVQLHSRASEEHPAETFDTTIDSVGFNIGDPITFTRFNGDVESGVLVDILLHPTQPKFKFRDSDGNTRIRHSLKVSNVTKG